MSLFRLSFIFSVASVMVCVVQANENCAFFKTNTQLVPDGNGYNATLTFSVTNACGTALQSIRLAKETGGHLLHIICYIGFENGSAEVSRGCTYDAQSHTFSATDHVDKGDIRTLVGRLRNDRRFIKTVVMSPQQSEPVNVIVPATVASVLLTIAIVLVILYWLRKKTRGVAHEQSRQPSGQQSLSQEDPYYLHVIHLPEDLLDSHPESAETLPKRFHTQAAEDEDGYTLPGIPRPTVSERQTAQPEREHTGGFASRVNPLIPEPCTHKVDDDGYTLAGPAESEDGERGVGKSQFQNTDIATECSDAKTRSHGYDDDGYIPPDPTILEESRQVGDTPLYINTDNTI